MALRNAFGGLALDETLKQMIERFRDWKDPTWVTSHPDMPIHVAGKIVAQPDALVSGATRLVTSVTSVVPLVSANLTRSSLVIYNNSAGATLYVLAANAGTVTSTFFTVALGPQDYWELPQGPGGCYKGLITGIWSAVDVGALVTEWSV